MCEGCGRVFKFRRINQRHCCSSCRVLAHRHRQAKSEARYSSHDAESSNVRKLATVTPGPHDALMTCTCGPTFTPLVVGREPDVSSLCDCGNVVFGEHQRALALAAISSNPPQRDKWDIARIGIRCQQCDRHIRAGQAFRLMTMARLKYCADCAKPITGEDPPTDLPVRRVVDQL